MNPTNENHEPAKIDDLRDRLVDRGLSEIVGRETVPNLSARILAAAVPATAAPVGAASPAAQPAAPRTRPTRAFWASLVAAAVLLMGATVALTASRLLPRFVADRSAPAIRESQTILQDHHIGELPEASKSGKLMVGVAVNGDAGLTGQLALDEQNFEASRSPGQQFRIEATPGTTVERYFSQSDLPQPQIGLQGLVSDAHSVPALAAGPTSLSATTTPASLGPEEKSVELPRSPAQLAVPFRQGSFATDGINYGGVEPQSADRNAVEDVLRQINRPIAGDSLAFNNRREGDNLGYPRRDQADTAEGTGPGSPGDQYARIVENPFIKAEGGAAVSTFSIDVDTASYANVRQFLMQMNTLPPPDAVRIEELINYFDYNYAPPTDTVDAADTSAAPGSAGGSSESANENLPAPFAAHVEVAGCPWSPDHRLVRIGIKGRELDRAKRPQSNLVFLVDVSGSMNDPAKLPLVVYGLQQLTRELGENDRVAIVVYASSEGLVLPSTPGTRQDEILAALSRLQAGGSTAGGAGIELAYQLAEDNFIPGGTNRVVLCTDGDFNVGVTSTAELERMVEQKAKDTKVFLTVLGFGRGNLNDAMMEAISNRGNGNYSYVDNRTEARRVLVEQLTSTLVTIAKDVKIQVEFNPHQVAGYRLIGYENRMLRTEDFSDDRKDAGEIGAGHTVTALYEIVPAGKPVAVGPVDDLKYQQSTDSHSHLGDQNTADEASDISRELLTLKMRYKQPDGETSRKLEWPVTDDGTSFSAATSDFQFAAAVAGFGMLLRNSQHKGNLTYAADLELAQGGVGSDKRGYRTELVDMIHRAQTLRGE